MVSYSIQKNIAVLTIHIENEPLNVLNDAFYETFPILLEKAYQDKEIKGIVITSDRPEFVVGADLKMLLKFNSKTMAEIYQLTMQAHQVLRKMETNGKPVVAAINGTALGGGFEICLACHHRIALKHPKTQVGLPEVLVGLLPGSGGTQRLPRMIGMEMAASLLIEGRKIYLDEAVSMGIVHDLADTREEMMDKAFAWIEAHPKAMQAWDEVNKKTGKIQAKEHFKTPGGNALSPKGAQLFLGGTAMTLIKTYTNYPAPTEIMTAVYEGLLVNFDKSLSIEARHFAKLVQSSVAKNLIRTMFFGLNEINKGANRPKNEPPTDVKKLGVLGAGMMGAGIAYVSAMAGIQVILKDVSIEQAEKGKDYTRHLLKKAIERGKMNEAKAQEIANLIVPTVSANDLVGCDLLIEAVFENRELKAQVTQEAEGFLTDAGVLGSNTSTLPITSLAKATKRPSHFIGIHFFSPVDKMQLVEIIMGKDTSDYALAVAIDYVRKIRKTPIVVNDSRGFYTSRVFGTYSAEGMELLKDGTDPQLIENVAKYMGMPVGPLAVTDEVALDLVYKVASAAIHDGALDTSDISYQMSKQMMDLGRLGKKVKAGFYDYPENGKKHLWKGLQELFPTKIDSISADDVKKRLLYRQALETVKCWEEGVIRSKTDADIGSIFAWGFPPYLGGTLSFVDTIGIQNFVKECDNLANQYGERFRPTAKLREMAASNQGFYQ